MQATSSGYSGEKGRTTRRVKVDVNEVTYASTLYIVVAKTNAGTVALSFAAPPVWN